MWHDAVERLYELRVDDLRRTKVNNLKARLVVQNIFRLQVEVVHVALVILLDSFQQFLK